MTHKGWPVIKPQHIQKLLSVIPLMAQTSYFYNSVDPDQTAPLVYTVCHFKNLLFQNQESFETES